MKRVDAGEFEKHGIYYSPDLRMPYPWEIKTSRSQYEPGPDKYEDRYDGYLKQLNSYQALDENDKGGLLVFFLSLKQQIGKRTKYIPTLRFYKVLLNKKERDAKVKALKALAAKLTKCVKTKKHQELELCPVWMCGDCPWKVKCAPWKTDPKYKSVK